MGEEQKGLGLLVLEDEWMMSWHPRTPSFIHFYPTVTPHQVLHQFP